MGSRDSAMTTPQELSDAQEAFADALTSKALDDELAAERSFREINERRAQVENTELLAHLRGL